MKKLDFSVNVPQELMEPLSKAILMGIQKAKISPKARKDLALWWEVEKELATENK
jgi:hypothetical protein